MSPQSQENFKSVIDHPVIREALAGINHKNIERSSFSPEKIQVFSSKATRLEEKKEYQFPLHQEAERLLPDIIKNHVQQIVGDNSPSGKDAENFARERRIGVVFSGGPAPGGHNVIAGLFDAMKSCQSQSRLYGFLMGPDGILESRFIEITRELVDHFRNMGGFSMIGTGRTKIDSKAKMDRALKTCQELNLDGLVIIGGDDSNTNAAFLAQHFKASRISVIGVPKTIDGDIQVKTRDNQNLCAVSFGFHSAARGFSENISNLCADAASDRKYWHVCKVMGRVASHLTLECALQTHANLALIGEELADYVNEDRLSQAEEQGLTDYNAFGITLRHLSRLICDIIVRRAAFGKNYGVIILPEGILEFINEIQVFIIKLNKIIADYNRIHDLSFHLNFPTLKDKLGYLRHISQGMVDKSGFPIWNLRDDELFNQLPSFFREGLLVERDLHGNFQFSQVKTETIVMNMVKEYLGVLKEQGLYKIGIEKEVYLSLMADGGLDPEPYANALFEDPKAEYLLVKRSIISFKTLKQALVSGNVLDEEAQTPGPVIKIFEKSRPSFKTQTHFYGYDGRGADPTNFDCNYTYNLGMTAFHLIAGCATGQMAAVKNLEKPFEQWQPIGIPIARLMHLEERKGKLELVIEKALVDMDSTAFKIYAQLREKWAAAGPGPDLYRRPGPIRFSGNSDEDRPVTLLLNSISI